MASTSTSTSTSSSASSSASSTPLAKPQTFKFKYSGEVAPTDAAPLLVSFPAGPPKNSVLHNPHKRAKHSHAADDDEDEALAISCFRAKTEKVPRRATQRLVVMETDAMMYHGSSAVIPARKITGGPNVARYVLGIVDKRSNTIELHECPQQIITMQQEVKGIDRQVEDHTHHGDYYATRHLLVEAFGGARSLKRLRSEIANRVSDDNTAVGSKTDDALRDTAEMAAAAAAAAASESAAITLPPYNKSATVPAGIYEIGKIIAPDCWGPLREASQALIAASRKEKVATPVTEAYPSSVLESLSLLASASTTKEKKQLASIMQFTAYVIKFYKEFRRTWNKGEEALATKLSIPLIVANHLLSLFAEKATLDDDKTTYSPSKVLQAKCINYILVLLLTINNFRLTLTQVVIDLGLKESTAVVHCKAIGCKISVKRSKPSKDAAASSSSSSEPPPSIVTATLNAPLVLPELTLRRGNKARQ